MALSKDESKQLLHLAKSSIAYTLKHKKAMALDINSLPADQGELKKKQASVVSLHLKTLLKTEFRGRAGGLKADHSLADDVVKNAFRAAFKHKDFEPLMVIDFKKLKITVDVLNNVETFPVSSEQDLINQIKPDYDGLALSEGGQQALMLPREWEDFPRAKDFIAELKQRAGWAPDHWSKFSRFHRFKSESIGE